MANSSSQRRALVVQQNFSPFSNKLVKAGFVSGEQMQQALIESRKTGRPLTDILAVITGQQLPPDLLRQYKKQQLFELKILYGVESLDPNAVSDRSMSSLSPHSFIPQRNRSAVCFGSYG
jgi:type IV pilus assembly protein PilB